MAQTTVAGSFITDNTIAGTKIAIGSPDVQGDIMYYNGTDWVRLGFGTSGHFLKTLGTGANPAWAAVSADTNTTYLTSWVDSSANAILRLTPSSGSADDLTIVAGTNITLTPSGDNLTIAAGGGDLSFGGDDFGANKVIGSNDAYALGIETSGSTRMTVIAGGNIGIGITTPVNMLELSEVKNNNTNPTFMISNPTWNDTNVSSYGFYMYQNNAGTAIIGNNNADRITITTTGEVQMPSQPAFFAYNSATDSNVTGDATIVTVDFDTELFDQGGDFINDVFTAPITGKYLLATTVRVAGMTTSTTSFEVRIVTTNHTVLETVFVGANCTQSNGVTTIINMTAGDTARVKIQGAGDSLVHDVDGVEQHTHFSGMLVA